MIAAIRRLTQWRRTVPSLVLAIGMHGCAPAPRTASAVPDATVVNGWITTPDRRSLLSPLPALTLTLTTTTRVTGTRIDVDTAQQFQVIDGFGAALTDASAWLIQTRLSPAQREALLQQLFGRGGTGAGFSFLRVTIGASDFSRSHFTFDDLPAGQRDDALTQFSIDAHRAEMLPVLRRALAINPALTIMATPWSAPAWMKTSGSLSGGTLRPEAFRVYAEYLVKFVDAYASEGVPVALLSVQNEPHHEPKDYPGMRFMPPQRSRFIGEHLGPMLARRDARRRPRILDWDHNWDEAQSPLTVLRDTLARRFVAGVAWHCYAGEVSAQSVVHAAHPDKDTWFTECAGGAWAPDFGQNLRWNVRTLVIGATRHWARGVALWNVALDERHGPHLGGCTDCRGVVTIDSATGAITYNEEFHALAHASRFVLPGARRIASTSGVDDLETVAFRNPDGRIALLVVNAATVARTMTVRSGARAFTSSLAPGAVVTFTWR